MQAHVTRQLGNSPLRYVTFVMPNGTRRGRRLACDIAAIAFLCLIYNATIEPLSVLFMLSSDIQAYTMHLAKRNPFDDANFICTPNRMCMAVLWFWHPVQGDLPMLHIIIFLSSITSVVFTFISYKCILERHGGYNGVMSVEFCRNLGNAIAFVLRLHPCIHEKIIATTIVICISILPFLLKILLKNNTASSQ
uniref:G_PROTEIN_RECEP_F1_2 domain-containing protein n=1 Tax=Ascaris lumbricoides TaxID=6252 RepID=A0A0M3IEB8_ASCLU